MAESMPKSPPAVVQKPAAPVTKLPANAPTKMVPHRAMRRPAPPAAGGVKPPIPAAVHSAVTNPGVNMQDLATLYQLARTAPISQAANAKAVGQLFDRVEAALRGAAQAAQAAQGAPATPAKS